MSQYRDSKSEFHIGDDPARMKLRSVLHPCAVNSNEVNDTTFNNFWSNK